MNRHAINQLLNAQPSLPFELHMSNGNRFVVRHKENVILADHMVIVYQPDRSEGAIGYLSYLHISDAVPLTETLSERSA